MTRPLKVLMVTSGWPKPGQPATTFFIKRQAEFLRAAGVEVDVYAFVGRRGPLNYLRAWRDVQRRLARGGYDLMHAQWGQNGLLAFPSRIPLVVTYRGGDLHGIPDAQGRQTLLGRLLQWICRVAARRADGVILVSAHMQEFLDPGTPTHVIPSGLDFSLFRTIPKAEARRFLELPTDKHLVLFAASPTSERKRYPLAKAAVDLLNRSLPTELIVAWGTPHEHMPYYMNACDAMVFTSASEGSPNVVKEALACNLPVASVAVGDVATRIQGVDGCELCPDDRPETIAAALERLIRRGGRSAGRAAVAELDENAITRRVIGVYRGAIERAAQRRRGSTRHPAADAPGAVIDA